MKQLLCLLPLAGAALFGQDLAAVHSVYVLPMSRGLDQYLANRLVSEHVFQVVTDMKLADAVFTDRVGEAFEHKLAADLKPEAEPAGRDDKNTSEKKGSDKEAAGAPAGSASPSAAVSELSNPAANSSLGRSKGTIFLVNTRSHQVLWSIYQPPKDSSSAQMDRTASDIVSRLKRDLKEK